MGDIVVGDIDQPQYHKCLSSFSFPIFFVSLYICDTVVGQCHQPQCHSSIICVLCF